MAYFNSTAHISDYQTSNDPMVSEQRTGKDIEGGGHGLICGNFMVLAQRE